MSTIYKIRDAETGLFSTGGGEPRWSKTGKAWTSLGALRSHLTLYREGSGGAPKGLPKTWEVVIFNPTATMPISAFAATK